jgi:hypothetical protein
LCRAGHAPGTEKTCAGTAWVSGNAVVQPGSQPGLENKKSAMQNPRTFRWDDIPVTATALPSTEADPVCVVKMPDGDEIRLLLLADGMFSPFPRDRPADDLVVACSRLIALHGATCDEPVEGHDMDALVRRIEARGGVPLPPWTDLPGIRATRILAGEGLVHFGATLGEETASVFLTQDPQRPTGTAWFSRPAPTRSLLVAIGRIVFGDYRLWPQPPAFGAGDSTPGRKPGNKRREDPR